LVVGAHDDRDVLQRDDDHHRPEDQAEDAEDVELVDAELMVTGERLAEGVDGRRADIAIDDADSAHDELVERPMGMAMSSVLRSFGYGAACRGDVHALRFGAARLRTRIPCAVPKILGHERAAPVALPFRPRN